MMVEVFKISDNIISSLGFDTRENFSNIVSGRSGISATTRFPFPTGKEFISSVDTDRLRSVASAFINPDEYTPLEQMFIASVHSAVDDNAVDVSSRDILFVISTVKGNIDLISNDSKGAFAPDRVHLWKTAEIIRSHFGNPNKPVVISCACISGTLAILYAYRMLLAEKYKTVIVTGGDVVNQFVVSGFNCLKAIDQEPCKPFDRDRKGLSLGEGAATIVLSSQRSNESHITISSGSSTNDANHISGPSRTGEGLFNSINNTLGIIHPGDVSFINAHGTGTIFNDEMESIAFSRCNLEGVPVNSYKGYLGHTLGAAGVIETILSCRSLEENILISSYGFTNQGTSRPVNIITDTRQTKLSSCLKTSSGFGGTNATILIKKHADE